MLPDTFDKNLDALLQTNLSPEQKQLICETIFIALDHISQLESTQVTSEFLQHVSDDKCSKLMLLHAKPVGGIH